MNETIQADAFLMADVDARHSALPDLRNLYARESLGMPDGWVWDEFSSAPDEVPPGFIRLRGAVCPINRKGRRDWKRRDRATERTVFLERVKYEAWARERAERLGECLECRGIGHAWAGWSAKTGSRYKLCTTCGGSGHYVGGVA